MSPSKRLPLIILHKNRVTGGPAQHPNNKKLLESWKKSGALYATPPGSNDDWSVGPCLFNLKHKCRFWLLTKCICCAEVFSQYICCFLLCYAE